MIRDRRLFLVVAMLAVLALAVIVGSCSGADPTPGPGASPEATARPGQTPAATGSPDPTSPAGPDATPIPEPSATPPPASTPIPSGDPVLALLTLAQDLRVPASEINILSYDDMEWTSTSLGCPQPGESYDARSVAGWSVLLRYGDDTYTYHIDHSGTIIIPCDGPPGINITQGAGLSGATRVVIARRDFDTGAFNTIHDLIGGDDVDRFVDALRNPVAVIEGEGCEAIIRLTFHMPGGRTEVFETVCSGDRSRVIRGGQAFWEGQEGWASRHFSNLVASYLVGGDSPPQVPEE